jgi:zinc transport system permease protein
MIEWLTAGWSLFGASYVAAWALAVALPLAGIPVVAREQALLGVGLVQMGACGFAVAIACGLAWPSLWAFLAIAVASVLAQRPPPRERPEAVAAWMILFGGAATVLILAGQPYGAEQLARLTSSSVLGASWPGATGALIVAVLVVALALVAGRRVLLAAWEPRLARQQGAAPLVLSLAAALLLALLLAVALKLLGALLTTALLVLPALAARRMGTRLAWMPWLSMAAGLGAVTGGFAIAWSADLPPGQVAVALLGGLLVLAWLWPRSWRA